MFDYIPDDYARTWVTRRWTSKHAAPPQSTSGARGVFVPNAFVDINDGNLYDATLFAQIMYWHEPDEQGITRMRHCHEGELGILKNHGEWYDECRIEKATVRKCLERLKQRHLIHYTIVGYRGDQKPFIRINWITFTALMTSWDQSQQPVVIPVAAQMMTDDTPVSTGHTPVPREHTPVLTEQPPLFSQDTPLSLEGIPLFPENTSLFTENTQRLEPKEKDIALSSLLHTDLPAPAVSSPVGEGAGQVASVVPDVLQQADQVVAQVEADNPLPLKPAPGARTRNMQGKKEKVPLKRKIPEPDTAKESPTYQRLFDGVGLVCFGIDPGKMDDAARVALKKSGGRIGKLASWLSEQGSTPEELWAFRNDYKRRYKDASPPRDKEKFVLHWLAWKQTQQPTIPGTYTFDARRLSNESDYQINPEFAQYYQPKKSKEPAQ